MSYIEDSRNIHLLVDESIEFIDAAHNGDVVRIKEFLNNGIHPDTQGPRGWTALRKAAERNKYEVAVELLNHGASIDATNYTGQTALMIACTYGHRDIASLLLLHGADPDLANICGRTALMLAASAGVSNVVGILLDMYLLIDLNKTDYCGKTALDTAVRYGHDNAAKMLKAAMAANTSNSSSS